MLMSVQWSCLLSLLPREGGPVQILGGYNESIFDSNMLALTSVFGLIFVSVLLITSFFYSLILPKDSMTTKEEQTTMDFFTVVISV